MRANKAITQIDISGGGGGSNTSNISKSVNTTLNDYSFYKPLSSDSSRKLIIAQPSGTNNLFLYNIRKQEYLDLKLIPESTSTSYIASLVKAAPIGVLHPINFYVGGGAKSVSFNFTLHEDVNGIKDSTGEYSIYKTLEVLKSMSEPSKLNNSVVGPSIYFQLGNQFAGKGHIDTKFSMKTPYRNGRYLLADISLTFTFHEEFKQDNIQTLNDSFNTDTLNIGYNPEELFGDHYDNWITKKQGDYDFVIQNTFGDKKLAELLKDGNSAIEYYYGEDALKDPSLLDLTKITTEGYTHNNQVTYDYLPTSALLEDAIYGSSGYHFSRPYTVDLATFYYLELTTIINPIYDNKTKTKNLEILKNKVIKLQNYIKTDPKYTKYVIEGSEAKPATLKKAYDILTQLIVIIETQIVGFTILSGENR